jgi:CRP/FNR family cyclic AMP-dependent transcriptional regulator
VTDLLALSADLPQATYAPGDVLIAEGAAAGPLYVLVSGAVDIERDGVAFARIDGPGAVFGEMAVVLGKPATATVRATSDVVVRVAADPEAFLMDRPGAALSVLRTTAARLDGLTQYLVDVKGQFAELEGHLGMVDAILDTLVHHQAPPARTGSVRDPEGDHVH